MPPKKFDHTPVKKKILEYLNTHEPASIQQIADAIEYHYQYVYTSIRDLMDNEFVILATVTRTGNRGSSYLYTTPARKYGGLIVIPNLKRPGPDISMEIMLNAASTFDDFVKATLKSPTYKTSTYKSLKAFNVALTNLYNLAYKQATGESITETELQTVKTEFEQCWHLAVPFIQVLHVILNDPRLWAVTSLSKWLIMAPNNGNGTTVTPDLITPPEKEEAS